MPEVLSSAPISVRARRTLEYENHELAYGLVDALDISVFGAYHLLHELKLYLLLCMLHEGEEVPVPPKLDQGLHPFLDSPEFAEFCKKCLGGTIEHTPHVGPMSPQDQARVLELARAKFSKHFDERMWRNGLPVCTCKFVAH